MTINQYSYSNAKTIYAPSTIIGKSAVAIIRITGKQALNSLKAFQITKELKPRYAHFLTLKDHQNNIIDNALIIYFPGPHSFTGEDIIELQLHGSRAIINATLDILSQIPNFALAEPGEFTRRATLNGKLDLIQAEGLLSVIHAETAEQLKQAHKELSGDNSQIFTQMHNQILSVFANIEAMMDFPEDDLDNEILEKRILSPLEQKIFNQLNGLQQEIDLYLNDNRIGEKIKEGFKIAIIGQPNVGKSSLLNYLAKKDIAIISPIAGTTRDLVQVNLNINGYDVNIIDTAGLRETEDLVESIGIQKAINMLHEADLAIILYELGVDFDCDLINKPHIKVITKMDNSLCSEPIIINNQKYLPISVHQDRGMKLLTDEIKNKIMDLFPSFSPIITSKRQRNLLEQTSASLANILNNYINYQYLDILAEEIRICAGFITQLTGTITNDQILDELFSNFCIGK